MLKVFNMVIFILTSYHLGDGNFAANDSGLFIHTGGWLFVHDNNSIEINLLECTEKENFSFDKLD